ncbi:MAG TPA: hypothetical protein VG318_15255 [Actinomycetota bacterium]|nr:hypothetical protein [Actinomycetota bacterium]
MLRKTKSLIAAGAAVAALAGVVPAAAADTAAVAACRAVGATATPPSQTVVIEGHFVAPGPYDTRLTCSIKQNGVTVASFTDAASGPVGVVVGTVAIQFGPYEVCHTAFSRNVIDGSSRSESSC